MEEFQRDKMLSLQICYLEELLFLLLGLISLIINMTLCFTMPSGRCPPKMVSDLSDEEDLGCPVQRAMLRLSEAGLQNIKSPFSSYTHPFRELPCCQISTHSLKVL